MSTDQGGPRMIPYAIEDFFAGSGVPLTLASATREDQPLVLVNDAFCSMSGYARDNIIGRNCRFLQGADREQVARYEIRDAIRENRDLQVTIKNYRADGTPFENLLFLFVVSGASGRPLFFMGSQFEIRHHSWQADLTHHASVLDTGVSRILAHTPDTRINRRRQLAEAAAEIVRERLKYTR